MFCTMCGKECADTAKFCTSCGNKLIHPEEAVIEPEAVNAEPEVVSFEPEVINAEPEVVENTTESANEEEVAIGNEEVVEPVEETETIDYSQQLIQPVEDIEEMPAEIEDVEETPVEEIIIEEPVVQNDTPVVEEVPVAEVEVAQAEESSAVDAVAAEDAIVAEEPEKVVKKKGFMSYVGLVFCYILLLVFCTATVSGAIARISISPNQLKNDMNKIDALAIEIGSIVTSDEYEVDEDDTVQDIIYKTIKANSSFDIKKSDIKEIYEKTEIKDYIAQKVADYAEYITTGNEIDEITSSEFVKLIKDNRDKIEDIADIRITSKNLKNIEEYLDNNGSELMEALTLDYIDETLEEYNVSNYEFLFNKWLWIFGFIGLGVLIILFTVFVFKLNKNAGGSIVYLGSIAIVVGSLFLAGGAVLLIMKKSIVSAFAEAGGIANAILPLLTFRIILFGAIIFTVGLLTVLIKKLVCVIKNGKNKAVQTPQEA